MKTALIIVFLILTVCLINWVRSDHFSGHILTVIPFLGGKDPGVYDGAGLVCGLIFLWGLARMNHHNDNEED